MLTERSLLSRLDFAKTQVAQEPDHLMTFTDWVRGNAVALGLDLPAYMPGYYIKRIHPEDGNDLFAASLQLTSYSAISSLSNPDLIAISYTRLLARLRWETTLEIPEDFKEKIRLFTQYAEENPWKDRNNVNSTFGVWNTEVNSHIKKRAEEESLVKSQIYSDGEQPILETAHKEALDFNAA